MTTSHPWLSSQIASATVVADDITTAPVERTRSTSSGCGQPEVETDDFGTTPFNELARIFVERMSRRAGEHACPVDAELGIEACERLTPHVELRAGDLRFDVAEEVEVERRLRRMTELVDLGSDLLARQHRRRQRTKTADSRHSHGQSDATRAGHRRLHNRQLDAKPI